MTARVRTTLVSESATGSVDVVAPGLTTLRVNPSGGSDANDGSSWSVPFATIGAAYAALPSTGGILLLAPATYATSSMVLSQTKPVVMLSAAGQYIWSLVPIADSSVIATADTIPPSTATLTLGTPTAGTIPMTLTATDNVAVSGFDIYRATSSGGTYTQIATNVTSPYTAVGLTGSTTYYFKAKAVDSSGNRSSSYSSIKNATTASSADVTAPTTPSSLTATSAGTTEIDLAWTASTDSGGSGLAGYQIWRDDGTGSVLVHSVGVVTSYADTGLTASTSYTYKLRALDGAGNLSSFSSTATATTALPPAVTVFASGGGYVNTGALDPTNPDIVLAGGDVFGQWISENQGGDWKAAGLGITGPSLKDRQISSFVHDPATPGKVMTLTKAGVKESTNYGRPSSNNDLGGGGLTGAGGHPRRTGRMGVYQSNGDRYAACDAGIQKLLSGGTGGIVTRTGPTTVAVDGSRKWLVNGVRPHVGASAEGLLVNMRMVQAIFDDLNSSTRGNWRYPDGSTYDALRQTNEFIDQVPALAANGVDMVTVCLQGGFPKGGTGGTGQTWDVSPWSADGSIPTTGTRSTFWDRLDLVLAALDDAGIVCNLQFFYFGQSTNQPSTDTARNAAMDATVDWLLARPYRGVIFNLANEVGINGNSQWTGTMFRNDAGITPALDRVRARLVAGGWSNPLVGITYASGLSSYPSNTVCAHLDWVGLQNNTWTTTNNHIATRVTSITGQANYIATPFPIVNVEDNSIDSLGSSGIGAVTESIANNVSPGFYYQGLSGAFGGGDYVTGYQSVPSAWGKLSGLGGLTGTTQNTVKKTWFDEAAVVATAGSGGSTGWSLIGAYPGGPPTVLVYNPANHKQIIVADSTNVWRCMDITAATPSFVQITGLTGVNEVVTYTNGLLAVAGKTVYRLPNPWGASTPSGWVSLYTSDAIVGSIDVVQAAGQWVCWVGGDPDQGGTMAVLRGISADGFVTDHGTWTHPMTWDVHLVGHPGQDWWIAVYDGATSGVDGSGGSYDWVRIDPRNANYVYLGGRAGIWRSSNGLASSPSWSPAVAGLGGGIVHEVLWDPRQNGAATLALDDRNAVFSTTGFSGSLQLIEWSHGQDGSGIAQDATTGQLIIGSDQGQVWSITDPLTDLTPVNEGLPGLGAPRKNQTKVGLIHNGSGTRVLLAAIESVGVKTKVGSGSWSTVTALGVPAYEENPIAVKNSAGLAAILIKGDGVYVSADYFATWTKVVSDTTHHDSHQGSISWDPRPGHDTLFYVNGDTVRRIVAPWATPTITDITGTLSTTTPALMGIGPNGHVMLVTQAMSRDAHPKAYRCAVTDLYNSSPAYSLVADPNAAYANIGAYPFSVAVNETGVALISFAGMGMTRIDP